MSESLKAEASIPCIELPEIPRIPDIELPFGASLKGFLNFAEGTPTDCTASFNLMIQLMPLLVSMGCLLKILKVAAKLPDFVKAVPNVVTDPTGVVKAVPDLVDAIVDLQNCLPPLMFPRLLISIKAMLLLVANFFSCFLKELENILRIIADLESHIQVAEGNPALQASLRCARESAQGSMTNLTLSLSSLQPLLGMIGMVGGMVGAPPLGSAIDALDKLSTSKFELGGAVEEDITIGIREVITTLKVIADQIPG
jgi:hypothetical protein